MKNKFTRFLCFFLCFALCFAWLGPPQQVHAAGGTLVGVLLMFLVGSGIGLGINGTAHSLADGFEELVKSYETNVYDGNLDFWDVLAVGSSIGTMGEVLLDKAATDLLNGFVNWLQSDKGWTAGTVQSSQSISYICPVYRSSSLVDEEFLTSTITVSDDGTITSLKVNSYIDEFSSLNGSTYFVKLPLGEYYAVRYTNNVYYHSHGDSKNQFTNLTAFNTNQLNLRWTLALPYYEPSKGSYRDVYLILLDSNNLIVEYVKYRAYVGGVDDSNSISSSYAVSIPSDLTAPDTSDWDAATSLGLFTGHSGKIPTSVEEYNDLVLQDINSGVIPEVTTDVIVGTPDQVLPDEGDGTLSGTVSGILEYVKALPESIANLILTGVESIFIPDPEHLEGEFIGLLEELNDVYSFDFDLDSLFSVGKEPEDIYDYYPVAGKSLPVLFVSWHYLKKGVEYFRPYIRGFIVLMLIFYNLRQFMAIFGLGGVMNGDSGDNRRNDLAV